MYSTRFELVNRQISEDFTTVWGNEWEIILHASAADPNNPDTCPMSPSVAPVCSTL
jgi:hypothetical protein